MKKTKKTKNKKQKQMQNKGNRVGSTLYNYSLDPQVQLNSAAGG